MMWTHTRGQLKIHQHYFFFFLGALFLAVLDFFLGAGLPAAFFFAAILAPFFFRDFPDSSVLAAADFF